MTIGHFMFTYSKNIFLSFLCLSAFSAESILASADLQSEVEVIASANSSTHLKKDAFDFLATQFPDFLETSNKPFVHCQEESKHYAKLQSLVSAEGKEPGEVLLHGATDVLEKTTLGWFGAAYENFMREQSHPMLETLQTGHPLHGYYQTFFERAYANHTVMEDLLLASEYLYQVVNDEGGGATLFLGRTPCLVKLAYERVVAFKKDQGQRAVHFNFSGHADALTNRELPFFKSTTNITRDVVTPEKLNHYFSYIDSKNILNEKSLFIVDILASGGSLNSFLRVLHAYFQERKTPLPRLMFLNLTQDMNWAIDKRRSFTIFERTGERVNKGILTLLPFPEKNIKEFRIEACSVPIFEKTINDMLDQDMFQEFLVEGIQYPAQRWTPENDTVRDQGGLYHKALYDYVSNNVDVLLLDHAKKTD